MKIGSINLENNVFLAPMAGITDTAFRMICKAMGAGLVCSEMISSRGLYYNDKKTGNLLEVNEHERPISLQIFGNEPYIMAKIVDEILNNKQDIDIIDINMGCPTPKIVKNGDGSALLKNPELVKDIVKAVVGVSHRPVTVKIRSGWDKKSINAVEIAKIIEDSGASAIAVHGRTREQFYSGEADWDIIKIVKENVSIPVIGNGDIFTPEDGKKMLEYTKCDAIMIGRGSRGNPWIFNRTIALIKKNENVPLPKDKEKIDTAIRHLNLVVKLKGERIGVREMRKHIIWYVKGMKNSSILKNKISQINNKNEMESELYSYLKSFQ